MPLSVFLAGLIAAGGSAEAGKAGPDQARRPATVRAMRPDGRDGARRFRFAGPGTGNLARAGRAALSRRGRLWQGPRARAFARLQRRLDLDPDKVQYQLVVPSISVDRDLVANVQGAPLYEQRSLFKLLRLANPRIHMTLVLSESPPPGVIDYYLSMLPDPAGARRRLRVVTLNDGDPRPLSQKLLGSRRLLDALRAEVHGKNAYLSTYNATGDERDLALALGLPLDGNDPAMAYWGTKEGNRTLFAAAGIPHPAGRSNIHSTAQLVAQIDSLLDEVPEATTLVVKLNHGLSGEGNARLDVRGIGALRGSARRDTIRRRLPRLRFEAQLETWPGFARQIAEHGAIVEQWIDRVAASPSVQGSIGPDGKVMIHSTHEQVLDGQIYQGSVYPAEASYRAELRRIGHRVGLELARRGVRGPFAVDTVVAQRGGRRVPLAIEINIREGGTTHSYWTARSLVGHDGFHYQATDTFVSAGLRGRRAADVIERIREAGLQYDPRTQTGVVLHLLGTVADHGKIGFTAIAPTAAAARALYQRTERVLSSW